MEEFVPYGNLLVPLPGTDLLLWASARCGERDQSLEGLRPVRWWQGSAMPPGDKEQLVSLLSFLCSKPLARLCVVAGAEGATDHAHSSFWVFGSLHDSG